MEEPQKDQNQPVMDILPPEQTTPEVPADVAASIQEPSNSNSAPVEASSSNQSPQMTTDVTSQPVKDPPAYATTSSEESKKEDTPNGDGQNTAEKKVKPIKKPSSHKSASLMAVMAVLVGAGLAVLSVYAYHVTNKEDVAKAPESNSTSQEESSEAPASSEAIDAISSDIDNKLQELEKDTALQEAELSDETLGL